MPATVKKVDGQVGVWEWMTGRSLGLEDRKELQTGGQVGAWDRSTGRSLGLEDR